MNTTTPSHQPDRPTTKRTHVRAFVAGLSSWPLPARSSLPIRGIRTTALRGYGEAFGFFALTFGVYAIAAIGDGAELRRWWPTLAASLDRWEWLALWTSLAGLTLWVAVLKRCRLVWAWAIAIIAMIGAAAIWTGGAMGTPDGFYELVAAVMTTTLAITLARRHGLSPRGFGFGRRWVDSADPAGRRQALTVYEWAVSATGLASAAGALVIALGLPGGHLPISSHENPLGVIARILSAGVAEEVFAAAVVIALSAARRPAWEIYTVPMLMRLSYHLYYQAAAPAVLIMGAFNVWLYRRTRRLTPLILGHITIDTIAWTHQFGTPVSIAALTVAYAAVLLLLRASKYAPKTRHADQAM